MIKLLQKALAIPSFMFLTGCAISTPLYEQPAFKDMQEKDKVLIGLTKATKGEDSQKNDIFMEYSKKIGKSLKQGDHPGLLGHRLRVEIFGSNTWTMTIWKDETSLNKFVQSPIHQEAIQMGLPALVGARFKRLEKEKQDIPSWDEIDEIFTNTPNMIDWYLDRYSDNYSTKSDESKQSY